MMCYNKIITWYTTLGSGPRYMTFLHVAHCQIANAQVKTHTQPCKNHKRDVCDSQMKLF